MKKKKKLEDQFRTLLVDTFKDLVQQDQETQGKAPHEVLTFAVPVWEP